MRQLVFLKAALLFDFTQLLQAILPILVPPIGYQYSIFLHHMAQAVHNRLTAMIAAACMHIQNNLILMIPLHIVPSFLCFISNDNTINITSVPLQRISP